MSKSDQALGVERVAAFLLSLEHDAAADLLARLEPGVMASVTDAMAKIDGALLEAKNLTSLYASLARDPRARLRLSELAASAGLDPEPLPEGP